MPGGPHGGPGGPHGPQGPHGPMGGGPRGPMFGPMGHYYFHPTRPAPGGYVGSGGDRITDVLTDMEYGTRTTFKIAIMKHGVLGGVACGIRKLTSGGLRHNSFVSKLGLCDRLLSENRITKEQCLRRKMDAAKKYNGYLLKCGYYDVYEYQKAMKGFAESIGVEYIDDVHTPDGQRRGSR